jgi:hypothetical protein
MRVTYYCSYESVSSFSKNFMEDFYNDFYVAFSIL